MVPSVATMFVMPCMPNPRRAPASMHLASPEVGKETVASVGGLAPSGRSEMETLHCVCPVGNEEGEKFPGARNRAQAGDAFRREQPSQASGSIAWNDCRNRRGGPDGLRRLCGNDNGRTSRRMGESLGLLGGDALLRGEHGNTQRQGGQRHLREVGKRRKEHAGLVALRGMSRVDRKDADGHHEAAGQENGWANLHRDESGELDGRKRNPEPGSGQRQSGGRMLDTGIARRQSSRRKVRCSSGEGSSAQPARRTGVRIPHGSPTPSTGETSSWVEAERFETARHAPHTRYATTPEPRSVPHGPSDELCTYVVVRGDLDMPPGKTAAQAVHAARLSLLHLLKKEPHRIDEFVEANCCGTVVVLVAPSKDQFERAAREAANAKLPVAVFTDSGHVLPPHFDGSAVVTALGIGPAPRESVRPLVRRFRTA